MAVIGKIHSFETFGTVDGPGIRFVIFAQGCPLRCTYCHNPDTWDMSKAKIEMTAQELIAEVVRYKNFIQKKGGVTFTGGEPLLQADFIRNFFTLCKQEQIHTALDTSGCLLNDSVKELLAVTDLVLLDIKSIDAEEYKQLTSGVLDQTLAFLDYLQQIGKPTWVRHVLIPQWTDNEERLHQLANYLKRYSVVEKVELLPYHKLGVVKYEALGMSDPLGETEALSKERLQYARDIFMNYGLTML
ncbi:MAG TPA: pyruvate formate-lyase-activating protein [Paludibacteraceae bacterium]|nr:pyruvate formate-lyase-activating protein [Paludibacteraceae bacterium]HRS68486.1 pyruvate formate-lyase-activating protein [Paludibacteraceae bacterium]